MKIAVFGAGALGGYFGARLLQAGHDVSFIARGTHLEALQRYGLKVESALGDLHIEQVRASDNPADLGPVDLVMFLVKLYDTEQAAKALAPLLHDNTAVISFQNGTDGWRRIGDVIGKQRVLGGIAYIFADIKSPGVIRHGGSVARLIFGEFDGTRSVRTQALLEALQLAGVDAECVDNIDVRIWEKFVMLSSLSGVTALTRLPIGAILADAYCRSLFQDAIVETATVGLAKCAGLSPDIAQRQMEFAGKLQYDMHASMLDDLNRGKPLELSHLSGLVARFGLELGIPTPVHDLIHRALHPYAAGT